MEYTFNRIIFQNKEILPMIFEDIDIRKNVCEIIRFIINVKLRNV